MKYDKFRQLNRINDNGTNYRFKGYQSGKYNYRENNNVKEILDCLADNILLTILLKNLLKKRKYF